MRLGFGGNPKGGAPLAWGASHLPLAAAPPTRWDLRGPAPSPLPLYIVEGWEGNHTFPKAQPLPSPTPLLLRVCLAKPCRSTVTPPPPRRRAAAGAVFLNLSLLLAGSRHGRRHRAARVLNAEAPLFGAWIGFCHDLNHYVYDSSNRVLVTLPHRDLKGCEDSHPLPLLLLESP